jgi:RNA polymerase sigma factor (sigma-70 family)
MDRLETPAPGSFGDVVARAYPSLRRLAAARAVGTGVAPSSLVQDTLCRMLRMPEPPRSEEDVQAVAFTMMKWVLIDRLRSDNARSARERGVAGMGAGAGLVADGEAPPRLRDDPRLEAMTAALAELAEANPRKAEVMTLSAVCGLTNVQIAALLDVSEKTVQRDLEFARAWLASHKTG